MGIAIYCLLLKQVKEAPNAISWSIAFPNLITKAGGRRQEAVFVTGIYAPLPKLFALKGEVFDPIFSIVFGLYWRTWGRLL
jgi:hypothetical protein